MLEHQELAARLLLTRRELMNRVKKSLRPLVIAQVLQILAGVLLIAVGAQCWARNTHVMYRVVCGAVVHVYGLLVILVSAHILTRTRRIDYSKTVHEVRGQLDKVRQAYLRLSPHVGFPWWLMWLPVAVCLGFDEVMHPFSLFPSIAVGMIGMAISYWLYVRVQRPNRPAADQWRTRLAGKSIGNAYRALREMDQAQIA